MSRACVIPRGAEWRGDIFHFSYRRRQPGARSTPVLVADRALHLTAEPTHGAREFDVIVREDVGVSDSQQHRRANPRRGRVILETRIAEFRHPVIGIVSRVVDALWSAETP